MEKKFVLKVSAFFLIATFVFILGWKGCNFLGRIIGNQFSKKYELTLKGTHWTSEFYHYKNKYFFQTDSTGYSEDGQYCWSAPIDPTLYNNSRDSVAYQGPDTFRYSLKDTILILTYGPIDTASNQRIFHLQKDTDGISFVSEYEYAYGTEVLYKKKK